MGELLTQVWLKSIKKQVDVLPSKNQALCDLPYNVLYNYGYVT